VGGEQVVNDVNNNNIDDDDDDNNNNNNDHHERMEARANHNVNENQAENNNNINIRDDVIMALNQNRVEIDEGGEDVDAGEVHNNAIVVDEGGNSDTDANSNDDDDDDDDSSSSMETSNENDNDSNSAAHAQIPFGRGDGQLGRNVDLDDYESDHNEGNDDENRNHSDDDDNDDDDDDDDDSNHSDDDDDDDDDDDASDHQSNQEPPEFLVHKFNFYLFPAPQCCRNMPTREVTMNPSSMAFLNEQEMDFREWIQNGIPYTTLDYTTSHLHQFHEKYEKKKAEEEQQREEEKDNEELPVSPSASTPPPLAPNWVEPSEPSDVAFIARSMANLREWIDSAAPPIRDNISSDIMTLEDEERFSIVKLLPYHKKEGLRNCLIEKIKFEYPSLHWYKHNSRNYVLRLSEEEKKRRDERIKRVDWQKMHTENIGFTRVFKALSDACRGELGDTGDVNCEYRQFLDRSQQNVLSLTSTIGLHDAKNGRRVPLVIHNGFMDLLFMMTHFHNQKLPSKYSDAKKLIHDFFPVIYDTKILATECSDSRYRSKNASLLELYKRHVMGMQNLNDHEHHNEVLLMRLAHPRAQIMNDEVYSTSTHRDASDDAFMTGAVFQCLSRPIINRALLDEFEYHDERTLLYLEIINKDTKGIGSLLFLDNNYAQQQETCTSLFGTNKVRFHIFSVPLFRGSKLTGFMLMCTDFPKSKYIYNSS